MRGIAGQCACERDDLLVAVRERVSDLFVEEWTLKGYELARLVQLLVKLDAKTDAPVCDGDVDMPDYTGLSPEELDALLVIVDKLETATPGAPAPIEHCAHIVLVQRLRERANAYLTSSGMALATYEIGNLTNAVAALDLILADVATLEGARPSNLAMLSVAELTTLRTLTAKAAGA